MKITAATRVFSLSGRGTTRLRLAGLPSRFVTGPGIILATDTASTGDLLGDLLATDTCLETDLLGDLLGELL